MPQLDLATYTPQIIWLLISFAIFWVLMARIALPRIGMIVEERQKKIADNLDMAQSLRNEAQIELEAYENAIMEAHENARILISDATKNVVEEANRRHAELDASISNSLEDAETRINEAKEVAIRDVRNSAIEVATIATQQLIHSRSAKKLVAEAVDKAILDKEI